MPLAHILKAVKALAGEQLTPASTIALANLSRAISILDDKSGDKSAVKVDKSADKSAAKSDKGGKRGRKPKSASKAAVAPVATNDAAAVAPVEKVKGKAGRPRLVKKVEADIAA